MRRARVLAASIGLLSLAALLGIIAACGEDLEVELTRGLGALGPVPTTPDNLITDAKVELGMLLMFDNRMSGNESTACTGCHVPDNGWGDGGMISRGYPGTSHWRNSQTIVNSAYLQSYFWAGEALSLELQAKSAWTGNLAGNLEPFMAEERMAQIPKYVELFDEVFGTEPNFLDALKSIATFERTVLTKNVPFDAFANGDEDALTEEEQKGLMIFQNKGKCIECHNGPLFTDESKHAIGVPKNNVFDAEADAQAALRWQHYARGVPEDVYRAADRDLGLYYTTKLEQDKGKFRTPPLRYLCFTEPYMHNGVLATLEDVIEFYNRGGGDDPNKSSLITPLELTSGEKENLVLFLKSLCGDKVFMEDPILPEYEIIPAPAQGVQ
jgi:cytochrome c peroxidase